MYNLYPRSFEPLGNDKIVWIFTELPWDASKRTSQPSFSYLFLKAGLLVHVDTPTDEFGIDYSYSHKKQYFKNWGKKLKDE